MTQKLAARRWTFTSIRRCSCPIICHPAGREEQGDVDGIHRVRLTGDTAGRIRQANAIWAGEPKALAMLDAQRLAVLPSSKENLAKGTFQNFDWWAENGAKAGEKFNSWLLS